MVKSFDDVQAMSQKHKVNMREGANILSVTRVAKAIEENQLNKL